MRLLFSNVLSFLTLLGTVQSFTPAPHLSTTTTTRMGATKNYEFALLFDCDGVILETEELHRVAYNEAFQEFDLTIDGVPVHWSVCTKMAMHASTLV